jgi:hypothetical protein
MKKAEETEGIEKQERVVSSERSDEKERAEKGERSVGKERAGGPERSEKNERFKLSRDEVKAAGKFSREEALALVGMYYALQKVRVAQGNRISAQERGTDQMAAMPLAPENELPIVKRLKDETLRIELQCQRALKEFASASLLGRWAMEQYGVGPVIASGLLAHIDIKRARWAGQIWSFGGLNPDQQWSKGEKRPFNAPLKKLLWNMGECFKRVSGKPEAFYGQLYAKRKVLEVGRNERGEFAKLAKEMLDEAMAKKWRISKEMKECWESGKLQKAGLDLRAMRYAVKIFLAHYHQIGREIYCGEKVQPWVIVHGGHDTYIPPPNWPME